MSLDPVRTSPPRAAGSASAALPGLAALHRVVLLRAPAGYGKTFQLAAACHHLRARGRRTAWLDLHGAAADAKALAAHLDALLQGSEREPLHLFIDGLDALRHTPAEAALARRIDASARDSGPDVRWLLAARGRPQWPLARWRAAGQLAEWTAADLRLDAAAASALLERAAGRPLPAAQLASALQGAEGWPAGLRLLGDPIAMPAGATVDPCPSALAEYFEQEVVAGLDPDLRAWLPVLGALPRFTAPLCDAATGRSDSHALIARLHDAGAFVTPLDPAGRTWRLHPLFAAFAARLLDAEPGRRAQVHRRAGHWCLVQGRTNEALDHAEQTGDADFLADTLERCWACVDREGNFGRMIRLAQSLPAAELVRRPMVTLWLAAYLAVERRFEQAGHLLDQAERALAHHACSPERTNVLRHSLVHRRLSLALLRDDTAACERHAQELVTLGPCPDPYLLGLEQLARLVIGRQRWQLAGCEAPAYASQALFMDLGHRHGLVWHACLVGPMLMQRGQVNGAAVHYRRAVAEAAALPGGDPARELASMPMALLAEAQLEQGNLEAARESFARAMVSPRAIGPLDASAALLIGRARLASHDGDAAMAQAMLDRAQALAQARSFERLRWAVLHERVRQRLAAGDADGAQGTARDAGLPEAEAALMPQPEAPLAREFQALARARLCLAEGRVAAALRLARAWVHFGALHGALATAVRAGLICSQALLTGGERRAAQRAVAQALTHAGEGGMVFAFVEAPALVRDLVAATLDTAAPALRHRLQPLLSPVPHEPAHDPAPAEVLNARESDVLRQAARGLLYKEIGDRLGLTEGSVKWYMQQIYAKLGVRRRLTAIERGRALGYL